MEAIKGLTCTDDGELVQPLRAETALCVWSRVEHTWAKLCFIIMIVGGEHK